MMNNYDKCMQTVIKEKENNLEFVTVEELVDISGYSYYHFHRIFKTHTGESLKKYIKRLQLERASQKMKIDKENITQLAIEAGFHMSSSFNKAFKERFDLSPSQYKKSLALQREGYQDIEPISIQTIDPFEVYAIRYVGACEQVYDSFEKLVYFAKEHKMLDEAFCFYGITYDDPDVTDSTKLRYDVCIANTKEIALETYSPICMKTISGGKYAVFENLQGPENLVNTYNAIFGKWLYQNDIKLRNIPILQKIRYDQTKAIIDESVIEIYIPIA